MADPQDGQQGERLKRRDDHPAVALPICCNRSTLMRRTTATRRGLLLGAAALAPFQATAQSPVALLNVSYDPTREVYRGCGNLCAAHWKAQTGQTIRVSNSHSGW